MIEHASVVLERVKEIQKRKQTIEEKYYPILKDLSEKSKSKTVLESLIGKTRSRAIKKIECNIEDEKEKEEIHELKNYLESKGYYVYIIKVANDQKFTHSMKIYLEGKSS